MGEKEMEAKALELEARLELLEDLLSSMMYWRPTETLVMDLEARTHCRATQFQTICERIERIRLEEDR